MKRAALAFLLCATPAGAETPMTAPEFDAYSLGKTLAYGINGDIWGIEQYLPDRRVRWAFVGDDCKAGHWYAADDSQICFVYDDTPDPHCWHFFLSEGRLVAQLIGGNLGQPLAELSQNHGLSCPGPDVGV